MNRNVPGSAKTEARDEGFPMHLSEAGKSLTDFARRFRSLERGSQAEVKSAFGGREPQPVSRLPVFAEHVIVRSPIPLSGDVLLLA